VRRKLLSLAFVVLLALATAGVAAAANGGFTPVQPESPNAHHIQNAYYLVLGFTAAIFVLVQSLLVVFIWKYRSRGRSRAVEGAQVHGHTRLELIWTAFPVLILAIIAAFVFYELPNIDSAPAAATDPIHITVEGHQYYWQFDYTDSPGRPRSIGTLHVPAGAVVDLKVVSPDVIHSWWIPALGGKIQAIPGRDNHTWFRADREGSWEGQCAELCGVFHASMKAVVRVESRQAYRHFVSTVAPETLGKQEWNGVCATCHGMDGTGGYGPDISGSALLASQASLLGILRQGVDTSRPGAMPPVGDTWNRAQIAAIAAYAKRHIYKASPAGAPSGG
jgi:cytochrome c oxidase subunit 2